MARSVVLLAAFGLLALSGMSGCIQVQVPTSSVGAGAPPAPVAAAPADKYPVTCILLDDQAVPIEGGSCDYRFGSLGSVVEVDGNGTAVRLVPTGASGTVTGTAPGHAGAKATLTVTGPKTVRMTLPEVQPSQVQRTSGNQTEASNTTQEAPASDAGEAAVENATVYFESQRDLLFQQLYAILPGDPPAVQSYTFQLGAEYQTLEVVGSYLLPAYAASTEVTVYGPDGSVVLEYSGLDVLAVLTGTGGSAQSFPIGFVYDPMPGEYRVSIFGAGAPALEVSAYGLIGLAPDFRFTDLPSGQALTLHAFAGRVVIVDLMASWCGPCQDAMPGLKKIRGEYEGRVEILSVDVDPSGDPESDLRDFIDEFDVDWPIGYETDDSASDAYGTGWIPTMVVVDQHGGLIYRHIGEIDGDELRRIIDFALAER
jgi:thiol-disulfide isomerase/thioredoxin